MRLIVHWFLLWCNECIQIIQKCILFNATRIAWKKNNSTRWLPECLSAPDDEKLVVPYSPSHLLTLTLSLVDPNPLTCWPRLAFHQRRSASWTPWRKVRRAPWVRAEWWRWRPASPSGPAWATWSTATWAAAAVPPVSPLHPFLTGRANIRNRREAGLYGNRWHWSALGLGLMTYKRYGVKFRVDDVQAIRGKV